MNLIHRLIVATLAVFPVHSLLAQKNLQDYIPSDARAVIQINVPSLATKMSWSEIQSLSFFEEGLKEAPKEAREFLQNPLSSGVNFFSNFYIVSVDGGKDQIKPDTYIYGAIADTAKFHAFIKNMLPDKKITKAGDIRLLTDKKSSIAWTPHVFVIAAPKKNKMDQPTGTKKKNTKATTTDKTNPLAVFKKLLTPAAKPLSTDPRFQKHSAEAGDIRFWINRDISKQQSGLKKSDELLKMMNMGALNGQEIAGIVNFESGRAVVKMTNYLNSTMDSLYRQYPVSGLNQQVIRKLPGGQPVILWSFNMSPDLLKATFKTMGVDKMLDSVSNKSKIKPRDLINGLKGDLTLAVIRVNEFDETDSITSALNGLQAFLAVSIKDKSKVQPFIDDLKKPKAGTEDQPKSKGPFGGMKPAVHLTDSLLIVSLTETAAQKFLASHGKNESSDLVAPYANHASIFSIDLGTIFDFASQMSKKGQDDAEMKKVREVLDRLVLYGGKYENGALHSRGELIFANSKENSLRQLITLVEFAAEADKKNKQKRAEMRERVIIDEEVIIEEQ